MEKNPGGIVQDEPVMSRVRTPFNSNSRKLKLGSEKPNVPKSHSVVGMWCTRDRGTLIQFN